jgi:hypothetical protein
MIPHPRPGCPPGTRGLRLLPRDLRSRGIEDHGVKALILASLGLIVILSFRNKNFSVIFDDEVNGK